MGSLKWMNIYQENIEDVQDTCYNALKQYGIEKDIDDLVLNTLEEIGNWKDISNSIIHAYFYVTKAILENKNKKLQIDYYVNGLDSHLYINNEEV